MQWYGTFFTGLVLGEQETRGPRKNALWVHQIVLGEVPGHQPLDGVRR